MMNLMSIAEKQKQNDIQISGLQLQQRNPKDIEALTSHQNQRIEQFPQSGKNMSFILRDFKHERLVTQNTQ
jgi:hypothetical protein